MALDAKVEIDDNALFRHPEFRLPDDDPDRDPVEAAAARAGLTLRPSRRATSVAWSTGPGLAMATADLIQAAGGRPADFLDIGGGVSEDAVKAGFRNRHLRPGNQSRPRQRLRRHRPLRPGRPRPDPGGRAKRASRFPLSSASTEQTPRKAGLFWPPRGWPTKRPKPWAKPRAKPLMRPGR